MEKLEPRFIKNTPYDQRILNVLKQTSKSLPTTSIAILVNLSQDKIDRILSVCQKHGLVRKVTTKKVSYWKFIGDDDG